MTAVVRHAPAPSRPVPHAPVLSRTDLARTDLARTDLAGTDLTGMHRSGVDPIDMGIRAAPRCVRRQMVRSQADCAGTLSHRNDRSPGPGGSGA